MLLSRRRRQIHHARKLHQYGVLGISIAQRSTGEILPPLAQRDTREHCGGGSGKITCEAGAKRRHTRHTRGTQGSNASSSTEWVVPLLSVQSCPLQKQEGSWNMAYTQTEAWYGSIHNGCHMSGVLTFSPSSLMCACVHERTNKKKRSRSAGGKERLSPFVTGRSHYYGIAKEAPSGQWGDRGRLVDLLQVIVRSGPGRRYGDAIGQ